MQQNEGQQAGLLLRLGDCRITFLSIYHVPGLGLSTVLTTKFSAYAHLTDEEIESKRLKNVPNSHFSKWHGEILMWNSDFKTVHSLPYFGALENATILGFKRIIQVIHHQLLSFTRILSTT